MLGHLCALHAFQGAGRRRRDLLCHRQWFLRRRLRRRRRRWRRLRRRLLRATMLATRGTGGHRPHRGRAAGNHPHCCDRGWAQPLLLCRTQNLRIGRGRRCALRLRGRDWGRLRLDHGVLAIASDRSHWRRGLARRRAGPFHDLLLRRQEWRPRPVRQRRSQVGLQLVFLPAHRLKPPGHAPKLARWRPRPRVHQLDGVPSGRGLRAAATGPRDLLQPEEERRLVAHLRGAPAAVDHLDARARRRVRRHGVAEVPVELVGTWAIRRRRSRARAWAAALRRTSVPAG